MTRFSTSYIRRSLGDAMEKLEKILATCLQDKDFDREYLLKNVWSIINSDGKIDNLEREYYEQLCCYLKNSKRRLS